MKMIKAIPLFILLFTGYLCNAQDEEATTENHERYEPQTPATANYEFDEIYPEVPGRSLPTLVVAGVSIALVLLLTLIVAVFWYAWKKSQEGSIEINPIPYGEAGVSLRTISVPKN